MEEQQKQMFQKLKKKHESYKQKTHGPLLVIVRVVYVSFYGG